MVNEVLLETLREIVGEQAVRRDVPMSGLTTFQIGGPAAVVVEPASVQEAADVLAACHGAGQPVRLLGLGSDLLVADAGLPEVIVRFAERFSDVVVEGSRVTVQAGASNAQVAEAVCAAGLAGYEFASGIPGTIGGAAIMNAGAYGGEMKDIIEKVYVLDENGAQLELDRDALDLGYRHSCIPEKKYIVTKVVLELVPRNEAEIRSEMKELNEKRAEKQPLQYPSAGSTFKRPEGYFAGKLIMDAGLRGYQVGGAQVSEKHCGFVINKGDATAADICQLMRDVSDKVQAQFGVVLEPEVKMIGEF